MWCFRLRLHLRVPRALIRTSLRHLRRCVSLPRAVTNWHFLPARLAITTSTRLSPAQPRSRELPAALMPRFREMRRFFIELTGASLSVQPPPALFPSPPLLFPPPVPVSDR